MEGPGGSSNSRERPARLCALLLAAGAGSRFGGPKLLAPLHGRPLLLHAVGLALGCATVNAGLWVVTGAYRDPVEACLAGVPAVRVHHAGWAQGMGGSIAAGVAALPADADALLLLLADQAALAGADLERLCLAWLEQPEQPIAAAYADGVVPGAPAIFPRSWWPKLAALTGDQGARRLLRSAPALRTVAMPAAGRDIDTAAQLARLAALRD